MRMAALILSRVSVSPVSVTELVVEKPFCNPIRAILRWLGKIPIIACMFRSVSGYGRYRVVLRLL